MLTIKATPLQDAPISEAFEVATKLAKKLDVVVEFDFGNAMCVAYPDGNADKGTEAYMKALKFANVHYITNL